MKEDRYLNVVGMSLCINLLCIFHVLHLMLGSKYLTSLIVRISFVCFECCVHGQFESSCYCLLLNYCRHIVYIVYMYSIQIGPTTATGRVLNTFGAAVFQRAFCRLYMYAYTAAIKQCLFMSW